MKKSEIKINVKYIIASLKIAKVEIIDIIKPYKETCDLLDKLQAIEEDNAVDMGIKFDDIKIKILRSCLEENPYILDINIAFEEFISDLEYWRNNSSENEEKIIQENYIDMIVGIRNQLDFDRIYDDEDLSNQLLDILTLIEEWRNIIE